MLKPALFFLSLCLFLSCESENNKEPAEQIIVYPQLGHSDSVSVVAYSPGPARPFIVSGSNDKTIKLWDADTGREIYTFFGHSESILALAVSPDCNFIASSSRDGIRIWNIETGKEFGRLEESALSIAFGHDNTSLYSVSADGFKVWNIKNKRIIKSAAGNNITFASFGANTQFTSYSNGIHFHDPESGIDKPISDEWNLVSALALSKNGKYTAAGSWDGKIRVWDSNGKETLSIQARKSRIRAIAFSNNGQRIAGAGEDGTITFLDLRNVNAIKTFTGHTESVNSVAFSPDDRYIVSASSDRTIKIWDTASGNEIRTIDGYQNNPGSGYAANNAKNILSAVSADTQYIATLTRNSRLMLWDAKLGQLKDSFDIGEAVDSIFFTEDNESIMTVSPDGVLKTYWIKTGKEVNRVSDGGDEMALARSFSVDGKYVASSLLNGKISIFDYAGGNKTDIELNEQTFISAVSLSADTRNIALGFLNGKVAVYDRNARKMKSLAKHKEPVESIQFSMDGEKLVFGTRDGEIHIIELKDGKRKVPVMRHQFRLGSLSFSRDGKKIISGAADNTTILWNAETGEKIVSFIAYDDNEWIVITKDGYYNSSLHGDERLNVRIAGETELYGMDQFSPLFYQDNVVGARLSALPDPPLVSLAGELRRALIPPAVEVSAPGESNSGRETINVIVKDRFNDINKIQIVINGRLLGAEELRLFKSANVLAVENTSLVVKEPLRELAFSLPVKLESGRNLVQIIAVNRHSISGGNSDFDFLKNTEGRGSVFITDYSEAEAEPVDLWVLAVGINNYSNMESLRYSVNNAKGIVSLFEAQEGKRYRKVYSRLIADGGGIELSKENILNSVNDFFGGAGHNDVLVLYLSGHGEDSTGAFKQYYFLPPDFAFTSGAEPDYSRAISSDEISVVMNMPGRKFILMDSCFSGGIDDRRLTKNLKNQSTAIFASSQNYEISREGSEAVGFGIFTESLIRGIRGEASENNEVKLFLLGEYVKSGVARRSGEQHPNIYIPEGFYDFVFAVPDSAPR